MRLGRLDSGGEDRLVVVMGDWVTDLRRAVETFLVRTGEAQAEARAAEYVPTGVIAFLSRGGLGDKVVSQALAEAPRSLSRPLRDCTLLAPLASPGKILGVGRNYGAHAAEGEFAQQAQPRLFAKVSSSVIGPDAVIARPPGVRKLDWEVELAVVVGRRMKAVAEEGALAYVAGYTVLNDVSAREFQFDVVPPQTTFAKSMDGFTPMGPWLVTPDEVPDPGGLELRCWVNGELMQEGTTGDMLFSVPHLLAYVSRYMTLEPGDVLATGTPAGVGHFRDPPRYLTSGDRVRMEIPRIGVLENRVV